jgi:hypothetical protein
LPAISKKQDIAKYGEVQTEKAYPAKNMGDVPGWSCEGVLIPKAEWKVYGNGL